MQSTTRWRPEGNLATTLHPYATLAYAKTLAHVGRPVSVPAWRTCVLARDWQNQAEDVLGPYPITCLGADSDLATGLEDLRRAGFVSVTLVVDGLFGPPIGQLQNAFTVARPFKTHYLVDQSAGQYRPSRHHSYEIRRAVQRGVETRIVPLRLILDAWTALYQGLICRHRITGVQRFTRESFEALAACESLTAIAAYIGTELVACHLWFQHDALVWSHLAASNARGYASGAAYAVCDHSIRNFSGHLINLGGSAGIGASGDDGLARFKAGFATQSHTAYLIGSVLDAAKYAALCATLSGPSAHDYFPAYRAPSAAGGTGALPQSTCDKSDPCDSQPTISR
jgi:hypothetical protein